MRTILTGSDFKVIICGRKCLNGKPYCTHFSGKVTTQDGHEDLYDLAAQLAESIREKNVEMELPHSIQITIEIPKANRP